MSQPERSDPLLTDSLRKIKETLGQFWTGLPRFLLKWRYIQGTEHRSRFHGSGTILVLGSSTVFVLSSNTILVLFSLGRAAEIPRESSAVGWDFRRALWTLNCYPGFGGRRDQETAMEDFQSFRKKIYTVGKGVYYNEADYHLENWQEEFWGDNYARLQRVKREWDRNNFFTCHMCVQVPSQEEPTAPPQPTRGGQINVAAYLPLIVVTCLWTILA